VWVSLFVPQDSVILSYMSKYVMFDHTADMGIEIFGRTKKELFANAARALTDLLFDLPEQKPQRGQEKKITVEGADAADLLINYLRELLYLFYGGAFIVRNSEIAEYSNKKLTATLLLEPYDKKKHSLKMEIKAVTYHGVAVAKKKYGWTARVIFDV
jgi:protein archease